MFRGARGWLSNGVIVADLVEVSGNWGIRLWDGTDFTTLADIDRWPEVAAIIAQHHDIDPDRLIAAIAKAIGIRRHPMLMDATCGGGWPKNIDGPITLDQFDVLVAADDIRRANRGAKQRYLSLRRMEFASKSAMLALQMIERGDLHQCVVTGCIEVTDLTIDHIVPMWRGGSDDLSNLQFMCRKHNSAKGASVASDVASASEPTTKNTE